MVDRHFVYGLQSGFISSSDVDNGHCFTLCTTFRALTDSNKTRQNFLKAIYSYIRLDPMLSAYDLAVTSQREIFS